MRNFKVGDIVRVTSQDEYLNRYPVGTIVKVTEIDKEFNNLLGVSKTPENGNGTEWYYWDDEVTLDFGSLLDKATEKFPDMRIIKILHSAAKKSGWNDDLLYCPDSVLIEGLDNLIGG